MNPWIGDVVGQMHINRIPMQALADKIGWRREYLSQVLNGHYEGKSTEEKVRAALDDLIKSKEATNE